MQIQRLVGREKISINDCVVKSHDNKKNRIDESTCLKKTLDDQIAVTLSETGDKILPTKNMMIINMNSLSALSLMS